MNPNGSAEIRVDKIKSRSGINTIDFSLSNDGFVFNESVGIGTSSVLGAANAANTRVLNVGVVTANNVYAAFTGDITGDATGLSGSPTITVTASKRWNCCHVICKRKCSICWISNC